MQGRDLQSIAAFERKIQFAPSRYDDYVATGQGLTLASILSEFSDGLDFLFHERESVSGGVSVP